MTKQVAIVSGGSTGIGKATAELLAANGYFVVVIGRNEQKLELTINEIKSAGNEGSFEIVDLSSIGSINQFISKIKQEYQEINTIVSVAGIWHNDTTVFANINFEEFTQEVILDTFTVGITAPTLLSHGLLSLMNEGSTIVNISGTFENGAKGWLPYYVSKKAIEDLTIGLSEELKDRKIYVNCVSPSDTSTEEYRRFFPQYIEDSVSPEEVANVILKYVQNHDGITGNIEIVKKQ